MNKDGIHFGSDAFIAPELTGIGGKTAREMGRRKARARIAPLTATRTPAGAMRRRESCCACSDWRRRDKPIPPERHLIGGDQISGEAMLGCPVPGHAQAVLRALGDRHERAP